MVYLAKEGIECVASVRRNGIAYCKLPSERKKKNEPGLQMSMYITYTIVDDVYISSMIWKGNKYVTLFSTYAEKRNPLTRVNCYN